jgi:hypothetical protein
MRARPGLRSSAKPASQPMHYFRLLAIVAAATVSAAIAQVPAPDVTAMATKFDAEISELEKAKTSAIEKIHQRYVEDLRSAERSAGSAGRITETAAILKELQAVAAGFAGAEPAPGLPSGLAKRRADALAAIGNVERDFSPRFQRVSATWLRNVTQIEATLPKSLPAQQSLGEFKAKVTAIGAAGSRQLLSDATFENTEWLWMARADKRWTFLPKGKIITDRDTQGTYSWNITGPNQFVIIANGKPYWEFKFFPAIMEGKGVKIGDSSDTKRLVFKRKVPK